MKKQIGRPKDLGYGATPKEWLHRVRCLTDQSLLELHERVFSSCNLKRWRQEVPHWAYRVDIERRVAAALALQSCAIPQGHHKRKKRFGRMKTVLRAPIRSIPGPSTDTKMVTPGRNNFSLRELIVTNPGMNYASL